MTPTEHRRPVEDGSGGEKAGRPGTRVAPAADVVLSRHARRLGLWHRLYRRPRWSKELDRLLNPVDPWTFSLPVEDFYHAAGLDRPLWRAVR